MTDEQKTTPAEPTPEVKKGKVYTYAALSLNQNFDDLVNNVTVLFGTNNFSKTAGIPSLEYFHNMMEDDSPSAKSFRNFYKACKDSPDVIVGFPEPQKTLGAEKIRIAFKDIPAIVDSALKLYDILTLFREVCNYKPDKPAPKKVKEMSMETLAEVKTPKEIREANES